MSIRAERGEHSALCDGVVSTLEEGEGVGILLVKLK